MGGLYFYTLLEVLKMIFRLDRLWNGTIIY